MDLKGKKILLGVSGGIAAYKSCELLRLLQKKGAEVRVAMTATATEFVAPLTFASLSKCPVYLKNGAAEARPFQHIDFPRWADLYLVVPATANVIGKFACGIADDPVSLCFMSCECPRIIAPAMNVAMYNSPAVKRNLQVLKNFENTFVLESPAGFLACGEVGNGRLLEPKNIVEYLEGESLPLARTPQVSPAPLLTTPSLVAKELPPVLDSTLKGYGKKLLLTAGRTEEAIDPVRYISNRSSGKTAVAIASVFYANGFDVEVIAGPMEAPFPNGVKVTKVQSACQMHDEVLSRQKNANILIHCAAVADYRPKNAADIKIKDSRSQLLLELVPNPNILRDSAAQKSANQIIIGFALETDNFKIHAQEKLAKSGADAILLNAPVDTHSGFGKDTVKFTLVEPGKEIQEMAMGEKFDLAETLLNFCTERLNGK